ncbi:MAG: integrase domain-containing protein [Gammaproteobacteria bacterium]|nr:integrase domain-containing protein [Gammaproteobacteria bacterium]MDH3410653.1 integrase domain-containing protein [Gammaproteobacteria bacterium]MDH3554058.1 integrase domain-containing protein [Gammaproteobacteria bacterium]
MRTRIWILENVMNKAGGHRNFGYGKQMEWAGKQALRDRYGNGHYGTVAGHSERWRRFVAWCRDEQEICDSRLINSEVVQDYGKSLSDKVDAGMSPAYAQNLLSSVNVVLEAMRGDRQIRVAPVEFVGRRSRVRTNPPAGLDQKVVHQCAEQLRQNGHERVAATAEVARAMGLRLKEASLLNARVALGQVKKHGAVNITAGTKGGRGHRVDRWVPVSGAAIGCLVRAANAQGKGRNLVPSNLTWKQWYSRVHHVWASVRGDYGLKKIHDLRAAYACDRYQQLTGSAAPVVASRRIADRSTDRAARLTIAQELGHARDDVVATYIGGAR